MKTKIIEREGPLGFVFFVAFVGAFLYFMDGSYGFGGFITALAKAVVWPAFMVYHGLQALGA